MNKSISTFISSTLLISAFILSSCSSGGGGSSDKDASVPKDAIFIDNSAVAEAVATGAVVTGEAVISVFGVEATTLLTAKDIINIVSNKTRNNANSSVAIVTGVDFSEDCLVSGSVSGDETETSTSYEAELKFNDCDDGDGLSLDGKFKVKSTFTNPSGPYTHKFTGSMEIDVDSAGSIDFNGLDYRENGNDNTGDYTVTKFEYAIDPSTGGGYAVELTQSIVGNLFDSAPCEVSGGQILVTGASGSTALATFHPNGTTTIQFHNGDGENNENDDGRYIESDNSPIGCLF